MAEELLVEADEILESQSPVELLKFIKEIESQLRSDVSVQAQEKYWSSLLQKVKMGFATSMITFLYDQFFKENSEYIMKEVALAKKALNLKKQKAASYSNPFTHSLGIGNLNAENVNIIAPDEPSSATSRIHENQNLSPRAIKGQRDDALTPEQDQQRRDKMAKEYISRKLKEMREMESHKNEKTKDEEQHPSLNISKNIRFVQNERAKQDDSALALQMYNHLKAKGLGQDEQEFADAPLESKDADAYSGQDDRFRPRKPRYFNSVKTGFEWNKYNQTHYDADNPPPKTVQGYKFNIFYPDLHNKMQTPQFYLENIQGQPDTLIIRFKAGAPYEELAFRIINKEWDMSEKHGFKSIFDKGVL